ncbi:formate dehydrogenase, partial [Pseudomonas sp. FW301-21B01]
MEGGAPRFGQFRKSLLTPQKRIDAAPTSLVELAMQRLKEPLTRRDANRFPLQIITRRRKQMMNSWLTETAGQYQREK